MLSMFYNVFSVFFFIPFCFHGFSCRRDLLFFQLEIITSSYGYSLLSSYNLKPKRFFSFSSLSFSCEWEMNSFLKWFWSRQLMERKSTLMGSPAQISRMVVFAEKLHSGCGCRLSLLIYAKFLVQYLRRRAQRCFNVHTTLFGGYGR